MNFYQKKKNIWIDDLKSVINHRRHHAAQHPCPSYRANQQQHHYGSCNITDILFYRFFKRTPRYFIKYH